MQLFADVDSVSSILNYAGRLVLPIALKDKSIPLDFEMSLLGIDLTVRNVTLKEIQMFDNSLSFVDDSDEITLKLHNIGLVFDASIEGTSRLPIDMDISQFNVTGLNVTLNLSTSDYQDQVLWQLGESSDVQIGDISVACEQAILQKLFNKAEPEFKAVLNYAVGLLEGVVSGAVDALNVALAHETEDMFVLPIKGMPFNVTATRFPEFLQANDTIQINMNGEFVSEGLSGVVQASEWPDYQTNKC